MKEEKIPNPDHFGWIPRLLMEEIPASEAPFDPPRRRRPDLVSALMVVVTIAFLAGTAWLRFGPAPRPEPPIVGSDAPEIRLIDLQSGEPIVLLGLKGKVVWLTFWSADDALVRQAMSGVDRIWKGLKGRRSFAMIAAAVDSGDAEAVRRAVAVDRLELPVYLAALETRHDFGVKTGELPVHVVIDTDGRVLAIARSGDDLNLSRLEEIVRARLEILDPAGSPRFAAARPRTGVVARETGR